MSVPCAHCGTWTCACGRAATHLIHWPAPEPGPLGAFTRSREWTEAVCAFCLVEKQRSWTPKAEPIEVEV